MEPSWFAKVTLTGMLASLWHGLVNLLAEPPEEKEERLSPFKTQVSSELTKKLSRLSAS